MHTSARMILSVEGAFIRPPIRQSGLSGRMEHPHLAEGVVLGSEKETY